MRAVLPFERVRVWSRTPGPRRELAGVEEAASAEEALAGADVVVTATSAREPILERDWLAEGAHVNAVGSSIPTTRELDTADDGRGGPLRRPPRVDAQRGRRLPLPAAEGAIGPEHIRAELGELLIGAAEGRRSSSELTVFKSLGLAVEDLAAAEHVLRARRGRGRRRRGRALIPLEEIRLAQRTHRRARACARRSSGSTSDADAEIYLKLETLQPVNSFKIRGAGNAVLQATDAELARGVVTASAGNMAQGVAYAARHPRRPGDDRRPRGRPGDEGRRDRALRRHASSRSPTTSGGACSSRAATTGRTASSSTRSTTCAVMAGNGTIGLELLEDLPDLDAVVVPYGGGGLITGIASAVKALEPGRALLRGRAGDRRRRQRLARRRASRSRSTTSARSSTAPAAAR